MFETSAFCSGDPNRLAALAEPAAACCWPTLGELRCTCEASCACWGGGYAAMLLACLWWLLAGPPLTPKLYWSFASLPGLGF